MFSFAFAQDSQEASPQAQEVMQGLNEVQNGVQNGAQQELIQNLQMGISAFQILCLVLLIVSGARIFKKAGIAQWKVLIPVYNAILVCRLTRVSRWHVLGVFIPLLNLYSAFRLAQGMSKAFGKGGGFTAGIYFLPFIFMPILAFGSAEYQAESNA